MMRRRDFLAGMSAAAAMRFARAQPRPYIPRIGLLFAAAPAAVAARVEALRAGTSRWRSINPAPNCAINPRFHHTPNRSTSQPFWLGVPPSNRASQ